MDQEILALCFKRCQSVNYDPVSWGLVVRRQIIQPIRTTQPSPQDWAFFLVSYSVPSPRVSFIQLGARCGIRSVAIPARQAWPISPVAPETYNHAQERPGANIVHVVPVVLATADSDHCRAYQGRQSDQRPGQILLVFKYSQLPCQEESRIAQPGKAKARVARGERPPAIVEYVVVRLRAHIDRDQRVPRRVNSRLAPRDQIRPRSSHHILDNICQEAREDDGDCQPEDRRVMLVERCSGRTIDDDDKKQRYHGCVDDTHGDGHSLLLGMRECDSQIVDVEHSMEGLDQELDQEVGRQKASEAKIVGRIGVLYPIPHQYLDLTSRFATTAQLAPVAGSVCPE